MSVGGETATLPPGTRSESPVDTGARSPASTHLVQFYEEDEALAAAVAKFAGQGLVAGDVVTTIATREHTQAFQRRLRDDGMDVEAALASGRLLSLDAHETLAKVMLDGAPDQQLFHAVVGGLMAERAAIRPGARLRAYGEMVDVLWKRDQKSAALDLEELWNDLQGRRSFTLLCAYAMGQFYKEPASIHSVCATHTHVVGPERAGGGPSNDGAGGPSEYAQTLAHEILHREEVELALRQSLRELRAKEQELRQREEQLRHKEEQLRDFVENGTISLHRVGPDGSILWANRTEMEFLGYHADEYVGRPIADFHVDQPVIADILARLVRGEALHDYEARLRAKDGSIKHVLINSSGYFRDGKFVHSRCFTRDITQRRRAEEALRESERQLQLITDALPVCVSFVDPDGRYRFVSAAFERWFGCSKQDLIGQRVEDVIGTAAYAVVGPSIRRALAGEPLMFEGEVPHLDGTRTRTVEATYVPQRGEGQEITGVVTLVSDISERKAFDRFRAAAAARADRLVKITAAVADAVTSDEVFAAVVDHLATAVDASSVALWLVGDDGRTVKLARSVGYKEPAGRAFDGISLDAQPSIPAIDALRSGEPVWISSQAALLHGYPHLRAFVSSDRSYRVSCLPLVSRGRTLGALGITIDEAREATDEERDFLLLVARYAGQAIERLRLLDAERKSTAEASAAAERLSLLNKASRAFSGATLDLDERLRAVASELSAALNSWIDITYIEADGQLHLAAVHHPIAEAHQMLTELALGSAVGRGEGVAGRIAASGDSVLLSHIDPQDLATHAPATYRPFLDRYPFSALIGVPLRLHGRIIGTVTAARCFAGESFTADDLKLLDELADRAAVAIENARLYRETVNGRARAEQLYRFAQAVVGAERVEVVFDAALSALEAAVGVNRAAILIFDDHGVMRFRAWRNLSEGYRRAVEGHSPWAADAVAPQPVLVADVETDPSMTHYLPLFHEEGIGSLAFIPLVTRGRLIGKFMLYYQRPHLYSDQEIELASSIANHLASVTARFAAIAKLEDTIRYNNLFAGILAHDLRNPLGAIMTAAELLLLRREGELDRNAKPLTRIVTSGQRMVRMIEQLLDVTRARVGGGIQIEPSYANLGDLCNQAVGELELAFPQWTIARESVGDLDGTWDPDRLLQIISNLLSNAGQHGRPEGVIEVLLDGRDLESVVLRAPPRTCRKVARCSGA